MQFFTLIVIFNKLFKLLFISFFLFLSHFCVCAELLRGKVVSVSDGDTITLLDHSNTEHKVRLAGIDAPEKKQPFGDASKRSLSSLIFNKDIVVIWDKRDRYQRILGKVLLNDADICLEQVIRGMAWHYKDYQRDQSPEDRETYSRAEVSARQMKVGLWIEASPLEPSKFRRMKIGSTSGSDAER